MSSTPWWGCNNFRERGNLRPSAFRMLENLHSSFQSSSNQFCLPSQKYHWENHPQETGRFHRTNSLPPDFQCGFRRRHVHRVHHRPLDRKHYMAVVFLDIFSGLPHQDNLIFPLWSFISGQSRQGISRDSTDRRRAPAASLTHNCPLGR